jgi:hypothetical protein
MKLKSTLLSLFLLFASAGIATAAPTIPVLPGELGDGIAIAAGLACIFIPQHMPYTNRYPDTAICMDNGWLDEAIRQDEYGDESSLGWGVVYERAINDTFSIRLRHGLVIKNFFSNTSTTYSGENMYISADDVMLCYYFDHKGLHGLNVGLGFGFANTFDTISNDQTTILNFDMEYCQALIGYKFNYDCFMVEPYFDLIRPLSDTHQTQTRIIQAIIAMVGLNIGADF